MMIQVHPPTGITHCNAAYFTQVNARGTNILPDLIVARSTLLQVYAVRQVSVACSLASFSCLILHYKTLETGRCHRRHVVQGAAECQTGLPAHAEDGMQPVWDCRDNDSVEEQGCWEAERCCHPGIQVLTACQQPKVNVSTVVLTGLSHRAGRTMYGRCASEMLMRELAGMQRSQCLTGMPITTPSGPPLCTPLRATPLSAQACQLPHTAHGSCQTRR